MLIASAAVIVLAIAYALLRIFYRLDLIEHRLGMQSSPDDTLWSQEDEDDRW